MSGLQEYPSDSSRSRFSEPFPHFSMLHRSAKRIFWLLCNHLGSNHFPKVLNDDVAFSDTHPESVCPPTCA